MLPAKNYVTPEEYLRGEENSLEKHEYFEGEVFLMVSNTINHNIIAANSVGELRALLRTKPCIVLGSSMRLVVEGNEAGVGFYTYPDALVICGKPQYSVDRKDEVTNPVFIIEVSAGSSAKYDRSEKFELYRKLDSLLGYLTIDHSRIYLEHHRKIDPNTWVMNIFTSLEQRIAIEALEIEVGVAALYEKVSFD